MTTHPFNMDKVDSSWKNIITAGLNNMDASYLADLSASHDWLPGPDAVFNAFSLPLNKVNFVLFGESPYPRKASANGYAFWDASITELWSATGLSKTVNRATSMRHLLKMLLAADGLLDQKHTSQQDIASLDKSSLIKTNAELFSRLLAHGFLLLNTTLVLSDDSPKKDAKQWMPFIKTILSEMIKIKPDVTFILLGKIAHEIHKMIGLQEIQVIIAEHPYNISFINNLKMQDFFRPFHLLNKIPQSLQCST